MIKFVLGLVVGLLCGVWLTALVPISPNADNPYEVVQTGKPSMQKAGLNQVITKEEHSETSYKTMANAFDEETQRQWSKITGDPVWEQLADEDKMHIWGAFEKVYVSKKRAQDNKG